MPSSNFKRPSCGVVIVTPDRELLLCHVTDHDHWDLPKGGQHDGETPLQAALRETREETGLRLDADALHDLGSFEFGARKRLHLYAVCMERFDPSELECESYFRDRLSGNDKPEMDGYGWFSFERASERCIPKLAAVLNHAIDLDAVLNALTRRTEPELAVAA